MRNSAEFQEETPYEYVVPALLSSPSSAGPILLGLEPERVPEDSSASFSLTADVNANADGELDLLSVMQDASCEPTSPLASHKIWDRNDPNNYQFGPELSRTIWETSDANVSEDRSAVSHIICDNTNANGSSFESEVSEEQRHLSSPGRSLTSLSQLQTNLPSQSQKLLSIHTHLEGSYNPSWVPPSAAPSSIIVSFPPTEAPSLIEDGLSLPSSVPTDDLTGQGRACTYLEFDNSVSQLAAENLKLLINRRSYRMQRSDAKGLPSLIEAVQRTLSFETREFPPTPPTREQLEVVLRSQVSSQATQLIGPSHILHVLDYYKQKSGIDVGLGIVTPGALDFCFKVTAHRIYPYSVPTLWLFHRPSAVHSVGDWLAIIPEVLQNRPSYAAALQASAPASALPTSTTPTGPGPHYLDVVNQRLAAGYLNVPHAAEASRGTAEGTLNTSQRRGRGHNRRSSHTSRATSHTRTPQTGGRVAESDKLHRCEHEDCNKSFRYRKDLHRHKTVHTKLKVYGCVDCTRMFSRDDNMKRHVKNIHPETYTALYSSASI